MRSRDPGAVRDLRFEYWWDSEIPFRLFSWCEHRLYRRGSLAPAPSVPETEPDRLRRGGVSSKLGECSVVQALVKRADLRLVANCLLRLAIEADECFELNEP